MFFSHPASLNSTSEDLFHELVPCKDKAKVVKLISQNMAQGFDHLFTCSMKQRTHTTLLLLNDTVKS